jgi:hypothetical protein
MGRGFQVWKLHLKISPWEEKPCLPRAYGPWEASFSSRGLIFGGEEISIPETRPIRKSYIFHDLEHRFILWKSTIFHSIKLPFDAKVDEKFLNVIYCSVVW